MKPTASETGLRQRHELALFDPNELQRFAQQKGGMMENREEKS
jgi:hypothetical protein